MGAQKGYGIQHILTHMGRLHISSDSTFSNAAISTSRKLHGSNSAYTGVKLLFQETIAIQEALRAWESFTMVGEHSLPGLEKDGRIVLLGPVRGVDQDKAHW
jgi:hypothetical protein